MYQKYTEDRSKFLGSLSKGRRNITLVHFEDMDLGHFQFIFFDDFKAPKADLPFLYPHYSPAPRPFFPFTFLTSECH